MHLTLRPLSTGQLLDKAFQTYRQNFGLFAGISALPQGCLLIAQLLMLATMRSSRTDPFVAGISAAAAGLTMMLVSIVVGAIATSATTFGVSDIYLEKQTSISACFARVKGKIGKVVYTSIEFGLRVGLGFVLLIIPGIYWVGKYGLAIPSVVLEDINARDSFKRSAELTKDAIGRILTIYFLTWVLIFAVEVGLGVAIAAVAPALAKSAGTLTSQVFAQVLSSVVSTVVTPVMSIALTLAYYDQRVRKEAFDIESMLTLVGEPPSLTGPEASGAQA
jgi:hypothetical protein